MRAGTNYLCILVILLSGAASGAMLIGDLNQNNTVSWEDLYIMASRWLSSGDCSEVGLVGHWKLDESIELIAVDSSGYDRHGILLGEILWQPDDGKIGGCLEFDGGGDYVEIPGFKGITGNAPRSCTAWIRTPEVGGEIITWGQVGVPSSRWIVRVDDTGVLRAEVGAGFVIGTTVLADNKWHHVAVTFQGTTTADIRLYVNGWLERVEEWQPQTVNTAAHDDVRLGVSLATGRYFTGLIDDVRIYDRALNPAEVWTLARTNTTDLTCPDMDGEEGVDMRDFSLLATNWKRTTPPMLINEFLASNGTGLSTRVGGVEEFPDWIEVYNPTSIKVDLTGWYLTDNASNLTKWAFPAGLIVQPGEYLVVFASGRTQEDHPGNYPFKDDNGYWHTNFRLSADGEYLAISVGDPPVVVHAYDAYDLGGGVFGFPPQERDVSYGLQNGEFRYFSTPTPGTPNTGGFIGYCETPRFNYQAGFYDAPFDLIMLSDTPGVVIRYTFDGSEPTETGNGLTYKAPLRISTTRVIRAKAFRAGYQPSGTRTASFLFNVSSAVKSLPILSIVGDPRQSLFEPEGIMAIVGGYYSNGVWTPSGPGDYNYPTRRGIAYERPVSVEILNPDGRENVQIDCGIRVAGSDWHRPRYTRGENWTYNYNKFSLKLFFRGSYGESRLKYDMFPLFPVDSFRTVQLRGGHNDVHNPFIKDEWVRRLHKDMGAIASSGTLVNLFINGQYKAFFNPTERLDQHFCRTWHNSDKDWDVITQRDARNGDHVDFNNMRNFVRNNSMANEANYRRASEWIDIDDFIDYLIIQLYCANWDWPQNNWTAARERSEDAKWRFYLWDVEGSLESGHVSTVRLAQLNSGGDPSSQIYRSLKASPDFRQSFADRIQKHFFADGALTRHNLEMRWHQLRRDMLQVLPGMDQYVLNTWIPNRNSIMLGAFRAEGLFGLDGPLFRMDGQPMRNGYVREGAALAIINSSTTPGTIWYTTDGADPRQPVVPEQTTTVLVPEIASKRVRIPTAFITSQWRGGSEPFNDSDWNDGLPIVSGRSGGVGYDLQPDYLPFITYDVRQQMYNKYLSCYIRIPFTAQSADLAQFNYMTLRVRYDDAFVAYINGVEVCRSNFAGTPVWNPNADDITLNPDSAAVLFHDFDISSHINRLQPGGNILAIHGMNKGVASSDFLISAELIAGHQKVSGDISESAVVYSGPITLDKSARVKARLRTAAGVWSALNEATYVVGPVHNNVRISEIMYNPADPNGTGAKAEFVELANAGDAAINLNLVEFTRGIRFTCGDVRLEPGERAIVVEDADGFREAYPDSAARVIGAFSGKLDNSGENLTLVDALGGTIASFAYRDNWFENTDGGGFSLTFRDAAAGLARGMAAHYKIDESIGSTVADCSGNVRNGIIRGMPYWLPFNGRTNGALQFYGEADYVEIIGYKGVLGASARTCSAWIKTTGTNLDIIGWGLVGTPGARWIAVVDAAGRLRLEFGGGAVVGTTAINDGRWHHIAVTLNGNSSDDAVLYVDGRREAISEMVSLSVSTMAGPNAGIGAHLDLRRYFKGLIDNVCIYDRALSAEEIALLAASDGYWGEKRFWRPSAFVGGSPGWDDTGFLPEPGSVVVNELLAHSHAANPDWVELHNTTDEAINIGGWFLSDRKDEMRYRIADNTFIGPYGYAVFYENMHFNNTQDPGCLRPFAFSAYGEACYVYSGLDTFGRLTGYFEGVTFGASPTDVAFGRHQKSTGGHDFVAMSANTPGAVNACPKVGPIVISEIMHDPPHGPGFHGREYEYVELHNISDSPVTLQGLDPTLQVQAPWRFTEGIDFTFPPDTTIAAGGYLVVAKNPSAFKARYGSMGNVVGPYAGQLDNSGERLELSMPFETDDGGKLHYIRVDMINYKSSDHWTTGADGTGLSLTRMDKTAYGNDAGNWRAATATPGRVSEP